MYHGVSTGNLPMIYYPVNMIEKAGFTDITIELRTHFHFIKKTKSLTDFFCHCQGAEENRNLCLQEGLTSVELTYVDNDITTEVMSFGFTPLRRLKSEVKFTLHHWITLLLCTYSTLLGRDPCWIRENGGY
ncbi:uncharacterized protein LOC134191932 isoform X2 [Corticium candelabrum]|uniref:uncharacterized protein LOC134191932 isoform X2 n=1 Tax=Corticium candelabrum TaxID=121492 RepID=UPI002E255957|nr:uncharacterized protein LOC134191932 isoform X2 [Corticium candelabrum]